MARSIRPMAALQFLAIVPPSTSFIAEHLNSLEDPRLGRNKDRLLIDILTISICAVICGAENQPRA